MAFHHLKFLKERNFDIIIVDYHMPLLNGLDTIKLIREKLNLTPEKQPIILLHSSSDDTEIYEECKKLGVIFNLTKPLKSRELLHYLHSIRNQVTAFPSETGISPGSEIVQMINRSSPVILVAEDVLINMILVTTLIKKMIPNVIVYKAKNGKEAFDLSISKKPDLIIMDIQMPIMSGIESALAIRKYEQGLASRIPIVALTAGAIKGEKEKCMDAGMDDFLTKPIDHNSLNKILEKHLADFYRKTINSGEIITQNETRLHFDQKLLMDSIDYSQVILKELLEIVPLQFEQDLTLLREAIHKKNFPEIRKAAHSIKGASMNMWFNKLAEIAKEIESYPDSNSFNDLEDLLTELILEWEHVQLILNSIEL